VSAGDIASVGGQSVRRLTGKCRESVIPAGPRTPYDVRMATHQEATFPIPPERMCELVTDRAGSSRLPGRRGRGGTAEGAWFSPFGDRLEGRQIEMRQTVPR
jgi:hypothetical protein